MKDQGTETEDQLITRREVFSTIVAESSAVYKLIVTVASSFLGGTLLFLERIAPHPLGWSLVILGLGWLALIVSIIIVVYVRMYNIRSGQFVLEVSGFLRSFFVMWATGLGDVCFAFGLPPWASSVGKILGGYSGVAFRVEVCRGSAVESADRVADEACVGARHGVRRI